MEYLSYKDDQAFVGMEKKSPPPDSYWHKGLIYECPKCRGYGGWILRPNAYGDGVHFKAGCMDCSGWGYVDKPTNHAHDWGAGTNVGNCLNTYTCTICGEKQTVDSSD